MTSTVVAWILCVGAIVLFQFVVGGRHDGAGHARRAATTRRDLHLQRKLQHALTGVMIFAASGFFAPSAAVAVLFGCAAVFYVLHLLRKRFKQVDELYLSCFHGLLRHDEIRKTVVPGAFYFLVGSGAVLAVFPTPVARLAILHVRRLPGILRVHLDRGRTDGVRFVLELSLGDPTASLVGTLSRHWRPPSSRKSLHGSLGCFVVCSVVSALVVSPSTSASELQHLLRAWATGLCAALAERVYLGVDDNLSMPLLSASLQSALALVVPMTSPMTLRW
ncbi:hypothetical protein P43SY_007475 [Pythium insidiosum]|uniref:Dolichol kinase n=1 Tax=Pythium insidiosum TaxID=114742 RepID=A0AAD5LB31_PYTIN|nr:hypothetical protein P43SY_007475 [Pythium insidiosum]